LPFAFVTHLLGSLLAGDVRDTGYLGHKKGPTGTAVEPFQIGINPPRNWSSSPVRVDRAMRAGFYSVARINCAVTASA
jgi:hypothetical protein